MKLALVVVLLVGGAGCFFDGSGASPGPRASIDATADAPDDAQLGASGVDAAPDAPVDAAPDAKADAAPDAQLVRLRCVCRNVTYSVCVNVLTCGTTEAQSRCSVECRGQLDDWSCTTACP